MQTVNANDRLLQKTLDSSINHSDALSRICSSPVFIYGAGNYGRIIYRLLTENGIGHKSIQGFLDRSAPEKASLCGLSVRRPDDPSISDDVRATSLVIISIYTTTVEHESIKNKLLEYGYKTIQSCYDFAVCFHTVNDPCARIAGSDFFVANRNAILDGTGLWADQTSITTYIHHFTGYATGNTHLFSLETGHRQYCAPGPISAKGHARIIDCGAFNGDSVRDWVEAFGKMEALALFEPCLQNFKMLAAFFAAKRATLAEKAILFPCGVWETTTMLRFDGSAASASALTEQGTDSIQCVSIDDALQGFSPTLIKMDIEGAEPQALKGAQETIRRYTPDLAISVYHSLRHFWEIPLYIRQIVPDYKLYLRTYGAAGNETIMYATTGTTQG